jgi:hypothetical protein
MTECRQGWRDWDELEAAGPGLLLGVRIPTCALCSRLAERGPQSLMPVSPHASIPCLPPHPTHLACRLPAG